MLFFQNLNLRWFHRDLFPGIQFKNGEVRAPPATRVLVAGSRGGELFLFHIKVELTTPTGKPVGFLLSSFACNRTPFAGFGIQV